MFLVYNRVDKIETDQTKISRAANERTIEPSQKKQADFN